MSAERLVIGAKRTKIKRTLLLWAARLGLAVVILGGWQLATAQGWVDKFFFARPFGNPSIWQSLIDLFTKGNDATEFGSIWDQIATTMGEAFYGFALGTTAGILLGILLGSNDFLARVVGPYIKIVNAVPRIVLGAIFIVAFGLGATPKVLLAAVLVFFIVFFNAFQGVREVDRNVLNNAKVLGASQLQVMRHVTVPSAMTWIIASVHTAFPFAIVGALVGEVLGAQKGLGLVIKTAQGSFDPYTVFACMIIVAVIVLLAEWLLTLVERKLQSWRPPTQSEAAGL